jgi:ribonuclease P protein component
MPEDRADLRFRPHQHLRRNRDFQAVKERGRRIPCGVFLFQAAIRSSEGDSVNGPRLGIITSRRVGPAVVRNRMRRRMREIFRTHQDGLRRDVDIVLVMRASAREVTFENLELRFLKAVEKSRVGRAGPKDGGTGE